MSSTTNKISNIAKVLALANGSALPIPMTGLSLPCTFYLTSAAAGRLIEYSVDGGTTYYNAAYDATCATQLVVQVQGNITHLRITGAANDTYGVTA